MLDKSEWINFCQAIIDCKNIEDLDIFLDVFLTISEREAIARRYALVRELVTSNKSQREISKDLKVSIANVTRGSNLLKVKKAEIEHIMKINK